MCVAGHDAVFDRVEGAVHFLDHHLWQVAHQPSMVTVGGMYVPREQ